MPYFYRAFLSLLCLISITLSKCDTHERRYLLYGVNFGEGFNLRRDVYLRIANVVRQLRAKDHDYILVLPPWFTPHWRKEGTRARQWNEFFDLDSLNRFVPVMEYEEYLKTNNYTVDSIVYLQHYAEGWDGGEYVIKYDIRPCLEAQRYFHEIRDGVWASNANRIIKSTFKRLRCLSIQGQSSTLVDAILELEPQTRSLYVDRVETILHDNFGDKFYWQARRSMRYSDQLRAIGDRFRETILDSRDESDNITLNRLWMAQRPEVGSAIGGNYICVHWRRRDFVRAHATEVPSINGTVKQIIQITDNWKLDRVFISTDAESSEYRELDEQLTRSKLQVSRFVNNTLSEGSVSIIDQWICSHGRYFVGTHASTFSFRIHEDREILGFNPKTTFNRLCPDNQNVCEQPAKWTIVY